MTGLSAYRFTYDDPQLYGLGRENRRADSSVLSRALSQNVRVTESLLPAIFHSVETAERSLGLDCPVQAFIFSEANPSAYCFVPAPGASPLVFLSSSLVRLLTPAELTFVVGHEIGHQLFGHHEYPAKEPGNLRHLELSRSSEVSADRAGLLACGSVETLLSATFKVASGLTEEFLGGQLSEFLGQVRQLRDSCGDESIFYSSHPPLPLRARAALRFDSLRAGAADPTELLTIDAQIQLDIDSVCFGAEGGELGDAAKGAAFWICANDVLEDGALNKTDQQRLVKSFGQDKVDGLKRFLANRSRSEVQHEITRKIKSALAGETTMPLAVQRKRQALINSFQRSSRTTR